MSAWITVYCARPVGHVSAADLRAAIDEADLYTIAEGFGIDDEAVVDEAVSQLEIEPASGSDGLRFRIRYRPRDRRPVHVHVWADPPRVHSEREEALEDLEGLEDEGAETVRSRLARVAEVVGIELAGLEQEMGLVLAGQVAEAFASAAGGIILDQGDDWWVVEDGVPTLVLRTRGEGESDGGDGESTGPPALIAIDHDDYHAQHVGRTADGRQFFLTTPFEPAMDDRPGNEFVALFLFDGVGKLLEAKIDELGPRATMNDDKRRELYDRRLRELGELTFGRIEIAPFSVDRFGTTFGLIPQPPDEEDDEGGHWWVELHPGNYMAFAPPWDSGEYDT